jgi:cytochrome c biogenesis protein CcdA/peroxiredoxin
VSADTPTLGLAFIAGFLSFISPCVLPLVPAYIGYMGGRMTNTVAAQVALSSSGATAINKNPGNSRFSIVLHGLFFVAGFTLVFVIVGMITSALLGSARDAIGRIGGVIIIFFGLHFMGVLPSLMNRLLQTKSILRSPFTGFVAAVVGTGFILWGFTGTLQPTLNKTLTTTAGDSILIEWTTIIALIVVALYLIWLTLDGAFTRSENFWTRVIVGLQTALYADTRKQIAASGRQGFAGSVIMGVVFAAGWTPCIGPILGSIMGIAVSTSGNDVLSAGTLLIAYSFGLGIPFLITAWMLDSSQGVLRRLQRYMHPIELITGGFLVIIGFAVASGQLQNISQNATQQFSDLSVRVENCGVGFIDGQISISHLGPCISGETPLFKVGNTVQNELGPTTETVKYIFHATAGDSIDIELKDRGNILKPILSLYDDNQNEMISESTISFDEKNDAIVNIDDFRIPQDGIYTLAISQLPGQQLTADTSFILRVKLAEPSTVSNTPLSQSPSSLSSITDAAASINLPTSGTTVGDVAPDFETVTETGDTIKLSDFRGQIVLLNFWGTWCGPCKIEMPEFQAAYEANAGEGFTILAVNKDDSTDAVAHFREQFGLSFPLLMDADEKIRSQFGVFSFPSTYIINQDGVITARHFGALTAEQIQELIQKALA